MEQLLLEMRKISKSFPGVQALNQVDLQIKKGTVHALMGENGAGKSTLMKCLFGIYKPDEGEIFMEGKKITIKDIPDAIHHHISMVHQELQSITQRSIAENIFCGRYPVKQIGPMKIVDMRKMNHETTHYLNQIGLKLDPQAKLQDLSVSQRQSVEIAKAISLQAKVIIMDEPTSSLTESETESLFTVIRKLKEQGTSIIYISHKIEEILRIADEVTIMRDGQYINTWKASDLTMDQIIQQMVGRTLTNRFPEKDHESGELIFEASHLTSSDPASFQDVSFNLRKGEILGIGGLVGAKRSELVEGLFGMHPLRCGTITFQGQPLIIKRPSDAIRQGIVLVTEDRRYNGIFGVLSVAENASIASLNQYLSFNIWINQHHLEKSVQEYIKKMRVKTPHLHAQIQHLSGGNQQKVIISRWLAKNPQILILDEPTRGIDVGAKYEIYMIMRDLTRQGKSIIMISSEMSELIGMSDRILVMCEGKAAGLVESKNVHPEQIMTLATQFM